MLMNLISLAIMLGVAYAWSARGFLSSLLHMACVIAAGAIAFGLWETVAILLIENAPDGFFSFIGDGAWGLGLTLPFVVSLIVLRVITDSLVRSNMATDDVMGYVGGGICGAVSGLITAGIFVNSVAFLRVPQRFMGYEPLNAVNQGNIEFQSNLWVPVDRLTGTLYNHLSEHTLSTSTPLARYVPDIATAAAAQRMSGGEGKNRNTLAPDAFEVIGSFEVEQDAFADFMDPKAQTITDLDGNPVSNAKSVGYVVKFNAGANEDFGKVVASKGQIRLVTETERGERATIFPIAVTAESRAGSGVYGRFRYATPGDHIGSVGGASESTMAFEFPVARDATPIALYVKNIRHVIESAPETSFPNANARDAAIRAGQLTGGTRVADLNTAFRVVAELDNRSGNAAGFNAQIRIPRNYGLQKGATRGIQTNDDNKIVGGEETFGSNDLGTRGLPRELRVEEFAVTTDQNIVQLTVTGDPSAIPSSLFGQAAVEINLSNPPQLIDAQGQSYQAIGFIYEDQDVIRLRYDPARPLSAMTEAPSLSRTRDDQTLILLFRTSVGVAIEHFAVGQIVVTSYDPPIQIERPRIR
ncbi:MAG: hypothetical protein AAGB48_01000 [Planctomycetota bacterium]